jgi:hypothetical protein
MPGRDWGRSGYLPTQSSGRSCRSRGPPPGTGTCGSTGAAYALVYFQVRGWTASRATTAMMRRKITEKSRVSPRTASKSNPRLLGQLLALAPGHDGWRESVRGVVNMHRVRRHRGFAHESRCGIGASTLCSAHHPVPRRCDGRGTMSRGSTLPGGEGTPPTQPCSWATLISVAGEG